MSINHYDLIIISPEILVPSLRPLEAFKNFTQIATKIISLENIYQDYSGRDAAEKVKCCLADYHLNNGIRFAMLVGDSERFPVRYTKAEHSEPDAFHTIFWPTDLYYADLFKPDGSFDDWDRNHNGYFGELGGEWKAGKLNIDDLDLRPDIAVGRVPASTTEEVSNYVAKVIRYECNATGQWIRNALLIATTDWLSSACKSQNYIERNYLKGYKVSKLYADGNPCEKTDHLPDATSINSLINHGVGIVSYIGHGDVDAWCEKKKNIYQIDDLKNLNNTNEPSLVIAVACSTAKFAADPPFKPYTDINGKNHTGVDSGEVFQATPPQPACFQNLTNFESLGENFTVKMQAGAICYVGCLTGAQSFGVDLNKFFFEALSRGAYTLGEMWTYMVRKYYEIHVPPLIVYPRSWVRVAKFHQPWKFILLGDPSLRLDGIWIPDVTVTVRGLNNTTWDGKIQFRANVESHTDNKAVKWSLAVAKGAGTINQQGLYTAPHKDCHNTAIATSLANPKKSGRMAFTVIKETK